MDLRETAFRLQRAGNDVRIFTPRLDRWHIPGGSISQDPGVPVTLIPMTLRQFNHRTAPELIEREVRYWNPDTIVVGNTFFLAPHLITRLIGSASLFLRVYAHEMVCINYMGMSRGNVFKMDRRNPSGILCGTSLPKSPLTCWLCGLRRMLPTLVGPRLNEVAFEYFTSLAFLPGYHRKVRTSLSQLNGIIVYNPFIRDLFLPYGPPVHVVPAGVDSDRFRPVDRIPNSKPRILLPGRADDPRKGFRIFAGALEILSKKGLQFDALVTDPRPEFLHPLVRSIGWIDSDQLPLLYQSVDIVVCPSIWPEPFGIIPLESMSCGVPVIASEVGGMKSTVVDGETGYLFPVGDMAGLAACIERLLGDPLLAYNMGTQGRHRVESLFNWDTIVDRITGPILSGHISTSSSWLDQPGLTG